MDFKSLTNIESSFRRIRLMLAVFVGCCTLVTVFALWNSYRFAEKQREYLQLIIPQYFISNKSGIWSLSLIVHSKG